jgi:diaminopimelate decarboxylase
VRPDVLIRVTTGVEAHTHEYIATAHEDQKFGFSIAGGQALVALVRCQGSAHLNLVGLHSHIGSQIFDTNGFEVAARRTLRLMSQFKEATGVTLPELDLGGGFGIAYTIDDSPATPADLAHGLSEIIDTSAGPSVWTSRCCLSNPAERSAALPAQRSTRSAPSRTSNSAAGSPGATSASTAA